MNPQSYYINNKALSYTYEWQKGMVFSVCFGIAELLPVSGFFYQCDFNTNLGLFEIFEIVPNCQKRISSLSHIAKEEMKFFVLQLLENIDKEETQLLTMKEPFN